MLHCYQYKGIRSGGLKQSGKIISRSEALAVKEVMESGTILVSIKKISDRNIFWQYKIGSFFKIYTRSDRFLLWWIQELSNLLKSGLSITRAVESSIYKANNEYHRILLYQVHQYLLAGHSFSMAAEKVKLFSKAEIALTYLAEKNGSLLDALIEMHQHLTQRNLSKSRRSSVVFPSLFLMVPIVLLSYYMANNILSVYVFDLWMQGKTVPLVGKLFLSVYSGSMTKKIISGLFVVLLSRIFLSMFFNIKSKKIKDLKERLMLAVPFKKSFIKKHYSVYFLSSLSFALKSNLPLHHAFFQFASVVEFTAFKKELFLAGQKIYQGVPVKQVLKGISFLDPGDKLILQTCLDNYCLDDRSIHNLLRYTYSQLRNLDIYTSTLINVTLVSILIFLVFFAVAAAFNIIVVVYI